MTEEDVMDRLRGKRHPRKCPICGKELTYINATRDMFVWDNSDQGMYQFSEEIQDVSHYCPHCNNQLDDDFMEPILDEANTFQMAEYESKRKAAESEA